MRQTGAEAPAAAAPALDALLGEAVRRLTEAGVPSPRVDAELLLAHVLGEGRGRTAALVLAGTSIGAEAAERFGALIDERARRIPLQHLTGLAPFRSLELRVGPGVFIPRPETEQVAQIVLDHLAQREQDGRSARPRVIDLGTGSGALAAAVAAEHPRAEVHAVELSEQAAAWAQQNLAPHGVTLHLQDLRTVPPEWEGGFDVVVSNPPYIPPDMEPTEQEVRDHDPELALYGGGADGLEMPLAVIEAAAALLADGGRMIMEHAEVQAATLAARLEADPRFQQVRTHQDLTGRDRATSAVRAEGPAAEAGAGESAGQRPADARADARADATNDHTDMGE